MSNRRNFLKGAAAAGIGATVAQAPAVHAQSKTPIKWRLQTYAGPALAAHVIKPSIDAFNQVAKGQMEIELFFADQLVPTGELFRAMQRGTIDAVQSDDDSIAAPVDISVFRRLLSVCDSPQFGCPRSLQSIRLARDLGRGLRRSGRRDLA